MDIPEGYRERVRKVTSRYGKVYTYTDLVRVKNREHGGRLMTSKSGKQYWNYYQKKGRPIDILGSAREKILQRASGHCERCSEPCKRLYVHHKDGNGSRSDSPNHAIDNLIAVCQSCHMELHGFKKTARNRRLIKYRQKYPQMNNAALGRIFKLSRERVRQIFKNETPKIPNLPAPLSPPG